MGVNVREIVAQSIRRASLAGSTSRAVAYRQSDARLARRTFTTASAQRQIAFAFDIDGVLKAGERVLPEAKRALAMLDGQNGRGVKVPYIFITNGGGPSEVDRAHKLTNDFGVPVGGVWKSTTQNTEG